MKSTAEIANPENPCSLAIIDGWLCRLNRKGRVLQRHEPIGTAVVQVHVLASGNIVALEHPYGFLSGFSNLVCLDEKLRLLWFFVLPSENDFYATLGAETSYEITVRATSGAECVLDLRDGKIRTLRPALVATVA